MYYCQTIGHFSTMCQSISNDLQYTEVVIVVDIKLHFTWSHNLHSQMQ